MDERQTRTDTVTTTCGECGTDYACGCHNTCPDAEAEEWMNAPLGVYAKAPAPERKAPGEGGWYSSLSPEPIEVMLAWDMPYLDASVLKYLCRHRDKNGAEDIRKAIWFLEKILEADYGAEPAP